MNPTQYGPILFAEPQTTDQSPMAQALVREGFPVKTIGSRKDFAMTWDHLNDYQIIILDPSLFSSPADKLLQALSRQMPLHRVIIYTQSKKRSDFSAYQQRDIADFFIKEQTSVEQLVSRISEVVDWEHNNEPAVKDSAAYITQGSYHRSEMFDRIQ